jgi:hypothetical protein
MRHRRSAIAGSRRSLQWHHFKFYSMSAWPDDSHAALRPPPPIETVPVGRKCVSVCHVRVGCLDGCPLPPVPFNGRAVMPIVAVPTCAVTPSFKPGNAPPRPLDRLHWHACRLSPPLRSLSTDAPYVRPCHFTCTLVFDKTTAKLSRYHIDHTPQTLILAAVTFHCLIPDSGRVIAQRQRLMTCASRVRSTALKPNAGLQSQTDSLLTVLSE